MSKAADPHRCGASCAITRTASWRVPSAARVSRVDLTPAAASRGRSHHEPDLQGLAEGAKRPRRRRDCCRRGGATLGAARDGRRRLAFIVVRASRRRPDRSRSARRGNPRGAECQPVGAVATRVNPRGRSSATGRPVLSDPFQMSTPSWDLPALPQSKGGRRIGASDRNLGRGESPAVAEAGHDDSAALLAAHPIWPGRAAERAASRS
jgi:hypothetical protein